MMRTEQYCSFDGKNINVDIYFPNDWKSDDKRSAIVLFHGGGWIKGTNAQFVPHAAELTRLGAVVVLPCYRLLSTDHTTVDVAVRDAVAAMQFVVDNCRKLGISQDRIVIGGGSAGGHLALSALLLDDFIPQNYNYKDLVKAAVLFNPVIDTVEIKDKNESLIRCQYEPVDLSPYHHMKSGFPDTIIFQGTADTVIPLDTINRFKAKMEECNNHCEVILYENRKHSFFNLTATNIIQDYYDILGRIVQFLYDRKLLEIPAKKIED